MSDKMIDESLDTLDTALKIAKANRDVGSRIEPEIETIRRALVAQRWQPIETAPDASEAILVWCPDRLNMYLVTWQGMWCHFGPGFHTLQETPTHWVPLPEPPETPND